MKIEHLEKTKVGVQIVVKRWQEKAAAHPSFLSDAQAGTNSKNNNDNFMRKSRQYFLSRFLDTGLPLFNIYSKGRIFWRRPNAQSVALRGGLRFLRLAEFVTHNRAAIGGPSKRQPMNSLVSSCLGSTQTPKVITLMYKKKIGEN